MSAPWPDTQRPLTWVSVCEWEPAAQHPSVGWLGVPGAPCCWLQWEWHGQREAVPSPSKGVRQKAASRSGRGRCGQGGTPEDPSPALQRRRGSASGAAPAGSLRHSWEELQAFIRGPHLGWSPRAPRQPGRESDLAWGSVRRRQSNGALRSQRRRGWKCPAQLCMGGRFRDSQGPGARPPFPAATL